MKPHKLPLHGLTRIFVPSFASQRPTGEADPVSLLAARHATARQADNIQCMNASKQEIAPFMARRVVRGGYSAEF
jgi:hypothetical protein